MKVYDKVKVIKDREKYLEKNIHAGSEGRIIRPEIRDNRFYVAFENEKIEDDYIYLEVLIEDLEVVEKGWGTDEVILEELPKHDLRWWCKVEDGYIINLNGERKKIK